MTKKKIREETIQLMRESGHYKPLYDAVIDLYADTLFEYQRLLKIFIKEGRNIYETTAANGLKTDPIIRVLENLRKDLMQLSDRLMLNPKVNMSKGKTQGEKESKLVSFMNRYGT